MALFDDFIMTGPEVKDGGHWNSKVHPESKSVEPDNMLAVKLGEIRRDR